MMTQIFEFETGQTPEYLDVIENRGHFFIVRLKGGIDTPALERGRDKMTAVIEKIRLYSKSIVCDFAKVTYSDTATLAALIKRFSDFRGKGGEKIVFFNIPMQLKSLLEIAKLTSVFLIRQSETDAIRALNE